MTPNRRAAFGLIAVGAVAAPAAARTRPARTASFRHGVAAGDPATDGLVLWTRLTRPAEGGSRPLSLRWEMAEDADFARIVRRGTAEARVERDDTVKVWASRLRPGRDYFYRFRHGDAVSPTGRARTLPAAESTEAVHFAVASCALWPGGLFNAYDAMARLQRVDAILHLGDYSYEYGAGERDYGMATGRRLGRVPEPAHETVTLEDYRARYAQYRGDPDLQAAHARAAWIVTFDDHEICNDPWATGAENHQPETEGRWADRKAAALRAWYEWMPIREPARGTGLVRAAERRFTFGRVASLHMVETRLEARSKQLEYEDVAVDGRLVTDALDDPSRALLGPEQLARLEAAMAASVQAGVAWQVIGNQTIMATIKAPDWEAAVGDVRLDAITAEAPVVVRARQAQLRMLGRLRAPINLDQWEGYPAERERFYAAVARTGARPVVLAGDSHASWASDLHDAGGTRRGVEFGVTAVSSPSPGYSYAFRGVDPAEFLPGQNPDLVFCEFKKRGFLTLVLTPDTATGEPVGVSTIEARPYEAAPIARFATRRDGAGFTALERV